MGVLSFTESAFPSLLLSISRIWCKFDAPCFHKSTSSITTTKQSCERERERVRLWSFATHSLRVLVGNGATLNEKSVILATQLPCSAAGKFSTLLSDSVSPSPRPCEVGRELVNYFILPATQRRCSSPQVTTASGPVRQLLFPVSPAVQGNSFIPCVHLFLCVFRCSNLANGEKFSRSTPASVLTAAAQFSSIRARCSSYKTVVLACHLQYSLHSKASGLT